MALRSVNYRCTTAALEVLGEKIVEDLVKRTLDKAYERNLVITGSFIKRFNIFTVDGKVAPGEVVIEAARNNPGSVGQVLPLVCLEEERGEDFVFVILQSEVTESMFKGLTDFLKIPPDMTVKQFIASVRQAADRTETKIAPPAWACPMWGDADHDWRICRLVWRCSSPAWTKGTKGRGEGGTWQVDSARKRRGPAGATPPALALEEKR
jgi:hypothetical protein